MGQKILVIDDTSTSASLAENALLPYFPGCDVLSATHGAESFDRINIIAPDLIVLNDSLPDMAAVLARIAADPLACQTPVILLAEPTSNARNGNPAPVVRVLTKPVSAETLREAVAALLGDRPGARRMLPARSGVTFSGHTGYISLRQALQMAQGDRLTGALRFPIGRNPIELWMSGGRFLFASTKNAQLYATGSPAILTTTSLGLLVEAQQQQQLTGCPLFLHLSQRHGFPHEDVVQIVRDHGQRLAGNLFTAGRVSFEFEEMTELPEWARNFPGSQEDSDNWLLGALRHVRFEQLLPAQRPDPNGSPTYTRRGYDLIQRLKLNDVEARFAGAVNGTDAVQVLAQKMNVPLNDAMLIVFRFQALEIVDFWNAGILGLPPAA